MSKVLRLFQVTLLAGALAIAGTSFMPSESQASDPCATKKPWCDGGSFACAPILDRETGEVINCTWSCV